MAKRKPQSPLTPKKPLTTDTYRMPREITDAVERLRRSDSTVTRRNARKNFKSKVDAFERIMLNHHPPLDKDSTPLTPVKKRGYYCHLCNVPFGPIKGFITHITKAHLESRQALKSSPTTIWGGQDEEVMEYKCWCGKWFKKRGLTIHLCKIPDIKSHMFIGLMNNQGGLSP